MKTNVSALLLLLLLAAVPAAAAEDDPVLWPERERGFLFDGPGFLLSEEAREEILTASAEDRRRRIDEFLERDPIPETPANELLEGIDRRRRLVQGEFVTFLDDRARALFLHGSPDERQIIECGQTFVPLEIWSYGFGAGRRQVVFYRPGPNRPHRLWLPLDSKRVLYNPEMEYYLLQWEELRGRIRAKRFDLQTCDETPLVDEATGVEGLRGFQPDRPNNTELLDFLGPPAELATWARAAAETELGPASELLLGDLSVFFPEEQSQRIVTRLLLTVPPEAALGIDREAEDRPEHRLSVVGAVEQDGELFEEFRMRFQVPPNADRELPVALAVERPLRPERTYLIRLRVIDEVGGAEAMVAKGIRVPEEPEPVEEMPVPDEVIVSMGERLAASRLAGRDSLVLAPPDTDVIIGVWRADALVAGDRIERVVFSVDGEPQLTKSRPPFSVELRLAEFPREQTVRADGYDGADQLVASDEVVLNQPRGSLRVRIVEPRRGAPVGEKVTVRAEVVVPEDRRVEEVQIRLNDALVKALTSPPWEGEVEVPGDGEFSYLSAVAVLDDGSRAEDVRYVNAPSYLEEVDVDLVEVLTTVLDSDKRPVKGLQREDFEIFEDGREQEIDKFEQVEDLPLKLGIAIDTSGSMASALHIAKEAAAGFLDNIMTSRDRVFAVSFAGEPLLLIPPTDDVRAVEAALGDLQSIGWTALHDAVVTSLYYFRGVRGRRALILLSDGDDTASFYPYRDVLEYARRSGVVIYTVGIGSDGVKGALRRKLTQLAEETGGRAFYIRGIEQLSGVYRQIEDELRSQYLLTYHSDNRVDHESFRSIEVKVKGRLKARALRGYYP